MFRQTGLAVLLAVATWGGAASGQVSLSVDCAKRYQTIVGLGTCGMHWTGGDLYLNKDLQRMYVEDLGASIIRFGVPPAVLPQEVADPKDIHFKDFVVNTPQARNGLEFTAAVFAMNPKEMTVIASVWSPPGWMKTTGKTSGGGQLRKDRVEHYAQYLAEWVLFMREVEKTPVQAVSIQNELVFREPYDSCQYDVPTYRDTVLATCDAFQSRRLTTRIFGPEHMTWDASRNLQYANAVLADPRGKACFTAVATHGYDDGIKPSGSAQDSAALWKLVQPLGLQWWMSETSGEQPGFVGDGVDKKGRPQPGAFNLANRIHNALVYGNASAWVYWCFSGHSKKANDGAAVEALMNGTEPTKKYFVSKQYYRFIRPGAVRVAAGPDGENNLQISAYQHEKNRTLTIVLLNHDATEARISLDVKAGPNIRSFAAYRTSETENCLRLDNAPQTGGKVTLTLPGRCVTTLYGVAP